MIDLKIDEQLCTGCGECARDCIRMILKMENGLPVADPEREGNCIGCQHCLAICKPGALSILGLDPAESLPLKENFPSPEQMETLIKGRRSCRRFKEQGLGKETIDHLLEVTANAPTAVNTMQTLFTVVDDPAVMESIRQDSYVELKQIAEAGALPERLEYFASFIKPWETKGADTLYRGAPHMLVASTPASGPAPQADGFIALSYFELLANSMGIGTVWCGLGSWMIDTLSPSIRQRLNIPEDHLFVYMMMFGRPALRYHRAVQRGNAKINRVR